MTNIFQFKVNVNYVHQQLTVTNIFEFKVKVDYVHEQLQYIDDNSFRGGLEDKIKKEHYPFAYDAAPDPGYAVENFKIGKPVAVEFQVHARNMPAAANFKEVFDYSFELQSIYLIGLEKQQISTPKNRKRGPDERMIAPPR